MAKIKITEENVSIFIQLVTWVISLFKKKKKITPTETTQTEPVKPTTLPEPEEEEPVK